MAKYVSLLNNSFYLLCFNEENKSFLQKTNTNISFINVSDEEYNKIKYDTHSFVINNNNLIFGDALFEPYDSLIDAGKPPYYTLEMITKNKKELIDKISYALNNNNSNTTHPSEWSTILESLKNLDLSSFLEPVRATNWVNAVEKTIPNTIIRGYKEI